MKRPKKQRLLSNAFVIENEGDRTKERLLLKSGKTMETEAQTVEEIKFILRDALKWGNLPLNPQTLSSRILMVSMVVFYTCVIVLVGLNFMTSKFSLSLQIIKYPAITVGVVAAASGVTLVLSAAWQGSVAFFAFITNKRPKTMLFNQGPTRGELSCIEALRRFPSLLLDYAVARLRWERDFQIRNISILGASVVFVITPISTAQLGNIEVVRQYWMFTPVALALPFMIYAICHFPILRMETARYLVELAGRHRDERTPA